MNQPITPAPAAVRDTDAPRLLIVDDEPHVLSSLRRSLRGHGYRIETANGGEQALELLRQQPVDAIVCDMRMPGISGAEVLRVSRELAPDAVRVLLTGYADIASAVSAVNDGEIFRYLSKPWDDVMLNQVLQEGLSRRALVRERDALRKLAEAQNEQLRLLNAGLEERVRERTAELESTLSRLASASERLKSEFGSTVRLLSSLIGARVGRTAHSPQAIVRHLRSMAPVLGLTADACNDAVFAALLHDIGKLSLPDRLVRTPLDELAGEDRRRVAGHPQIGESVLMGLQSLRGAAQLLGQVNENHDGSGIPGRAAGEAIALGARMLRVAADFEHLLAGAITVTPFTPEQAFRRLRQFRGSLYDPRVVDAMLAAHHQPVTAPARKVLLSSDSLRPGMVLAQDLHSSNGMLLLSTGQTVDLAKIAHLRRIESMTGDFFWITVCSDERLEATAAQLCGSAL